MSDYYTCKYAYAAALPLCRHPAIAGYGPLAVRVDVKKDCKNCEYYKNEEDKMNENNGLKRCPFCGKKAILKEISGRWAVCCEGQCVGTRIYNDKQKSIDVWNQRAENRAKPSNDKELL